MKRFVTSFLIALSLFTCNILYAQEIVKHIVQKGETIESIANNYGTTVIEILSLNPRANKFLYVGMELQIPPKNNSQDNAPETEIEMIESPEETTTSKNTLHSQSGKQATNNVHYSEDSYMNQVSSVINQSTSVDHFMVSYDLSLADKPENTSVWGLSFLFSTNEYLGDSFYIGTGSGMSLGRSSMKYDTYKFTTTAFYLNFPIYFGISPIEGLDIDTGPSFNWLIGGSMKEFDGSREISETRYRDMKDLNHFTPTWRVSVRLADCIHVGLNIGLKKDSGTHITLGLYF